MNKEIVYPWHLAPDWAQWAATNSDGNFLWYENEPYLSIMIWLIDDGRYSDGSKAPFKGCPDWRQSLQKRPEQ